MSDLHSVTNVCFFDRYGSAWKSDLFDFVSHENSWSEEGIEVYPDDHANYYERALTKGRKMTTRIFSVLYRPRLSHRKHTLSSSVYSASVK